MPSGFQGLEENFPRVGKLGIIKSLLLLHKVTGLNLHLLRVLSI